MSARDEINSMVKQAQNPAYSHYVKMSPQDRAKYYEFYKNKTGTGDRMADGFVRLFELDARKQREQDARRAYADKIDKEERAKAQADANRRRAAEQARENAEWNMKMMRFWNNEDASAAPAKPTVPNASGPRHKDAFNTMMADLAKRTGTTYWHDGRVAYPAK